MYEEPSSQVEVQTQAYTNKPQRIRNIPIRLQDFIVTPNNVFNDKGKTIHYAFHTYIKLVSVAKALKDHKWVSAMIEELESIEANKTWSIVDLPQNKVK